MKIFGFLITIKKASCNHKFDPKDVMNFNIDPCCVKCKTPLSQFENKKFDTIEIMTKLRIAGYGNQFCLNVIEALFK